jgi:hypothetical protein
MDNLSIGKELTGKGERPHDRYTVPLCPYHHRIGVDCQHNSNEREWWNEPESIRGKSPRHSGSDPAAPLARSNQSPHRASEKPKRVNPQSNEPRSKGARGGRQAASCSPGIHLRSAEHDQQNRLVLRPVLARNVRRLAGA